MTDIYTILYIHGMGGGADSRIPSLLRETFVDSHVDVICRTYDFDPEIAREQIVVWVDEVKPSLVVGESLGSLHALQIKDIPCLLVSPAVNAPIYFEILAWLTLIPGVTQLFDWMYRPKEGDRQSLHFTFKVLRKYLKHRSEALRCSADRNCPLHAFFGKHDHYRRSGIVSVRAWKRHFDGDFIMYDGTHFMEDEYIASLLIPKIKSLI